MSMSKSVSVSELYSIKNSVYTIGLTMHSKSDFSNGQKEKWESISASWFDFNPPASPSLEDIKNFEQLLREALLGGEPQGTVIVLGCTPSLRDMLATGDSFKQLRVVCVDFSERMYIETSKVIKYPNPNERFEQADWRNFDIGEASCIAVLGDKVIDSIMPHDWTSFFQRIYYHLRPGGHFIVHLALLDNRFKDIKFMAAFENWFNRVRNFEVSLFQAASGLWDELLSASGFKGSINNLTLTVERYADEIEKARVALMREDTPLLKKKLLIEFIHLYSSTKDYTWSCYNYDQILKYMDEFFSHYKTVYSTDYEVAETQPIVSLSVRK